MKSQIQNKKKKIKLFNRQIVSKGDKINSAPAIRNLYQKLDHLKSLKEQFASLKSQKKSLKTLLPLQHQDIEENMQEKEQIEDITSKLRVEKELNGKLKKKKAKLMKKTMILHTQKVDLSKKLRILKKDFEEVPAQIKRTLNTKTSELDDQEIDDITLKQKIKEIDVQLAKEEQLYQEEMTLLETQIRKEDFNLNINQMKYKLISEKVSKLQKQHSDILRIANKTIKASQNNLDTPSKEEKGNS